MKILSYRQTGGAAPAGPLPPQPGNDTLEDLHSQGFFATEGHRPQGRRSLPRNRCASHASPSTAHSFVAVVKTMTNRTERM
jgi:hypothetical protein